jgi:hypothetical protein
MLGEIKARRSTYCLCSNCNSGFFDYRYSEVELNKIYADYRGDHYFKIRQSWEPSYSKNLNHSLGNSAEVLKARHQFVLSALSHAPHTSVSTVVDVGGDKGQFIPDNIPNKYVLDVSGKQPIQGVKNVSDVKEAMGIRPDLVMACGVLEHVPKPDEFLTELVKILPEQSRGLIYVEVPSGVPKKRSFSSRIAGNVSGVTASRLRSLWAFMDSRAAQIKSRKGNPLQPMPLRQSEHLNFFSQRGLRLLATNAGTRVVLLDEISVPTELLDGGRIQFSSTLRMLVTTDNK